MGMQIEDEVWGCEIRACGGDVLMEANMGQKYVGKWRGRVVLISIPVSSGASVILCERGEARYEGPDVRTLAPGSDVLTLAVLIAITTQKS